MSKPAFGESAQRILVAYFSHSGNTRAIAAQIQEIVGGSLFEIMAVAPYPRNYDAVVKQAKREQETDYQPELKTKMEGIEAYTVVFLGYPNWWGTLPRPVAAFLSQCDLSGKTIVPFCTHEGSRFGRSVQDIARLGPQSTILEGLAVRGRAAKNARNEVSAWLHEIGMTE